MQSNIGIEFIKKNTHNTILKRWIVLIGKCHFTGSPRSYTDSPYMMYNNMHPSGGANDFYGRSPGKGTYTQTYKYKKNNNDDLLTSQDK